MTESLLPFHCNLKVTYLKAAIQLMSGGKGLSYRRRRGQGKQPIETEIRSLGHGHTGY